VAQKIRQTPDQLPLAMQIDSELSDKGIYDHHIREDEYGDGELANAKAPIPN
jgi:hypothetical protein